MNKLPLVSGLMAALVSMNAASADTPSMEEMWKLIQQQQAEIQALKAELQSTRQTVQTQEQQVSQTRQQVAQAEQQVAATEASVQELLDAGEGASDWADKTHLGGYGELHYNAGDRDRIDFHRFVLFFGHQFNENTRFNSELELEHSLAGEGKPGEIELEQAYIERDLAPGLRAKGGLFLLPIGILNEHHEPNTFFGVERNPIESNIIPTTWWEGGAALSGQNDAGLSWDAALHSGLATSAGNGYAIRSGRKKVAEAPAKDAAYTLRMKYQIPGLQLAASYQRQDDITQSADPLAGAADLYTAHAIWTYEGFGLRALWARWNLDGSGPAAIGADVQEGFYVEPSYRFGSSWGVFARLNQWDNRAGDSQDSEWQQTDVGLNYWLNANVVLKADYQFQDAPAGAAEDDRVNLGIGYQF